MKNINNNGVFRTYIHFGKIGIKIVKFNPKYTNAFCAFLCGIIMNILERRRYKYYVLKKKMNQWGRTWQTSFKEVRLAPCYFSCGLFSIYKHLNKEITWSEYDSEIKDNEIFAYLNNDHKLENYRRDEDNKIYLVDYGDFNILGFNNTNVKDIDYR